MKVVVDGEESISVTVGSGIPQGTVLGPLKFLSHINDLPDAVKSTVRLFADDLLLCRSLRNMDDHLALETFALYSRNSLTTSLYNLFHEKSLLKG